MSDLGQECGQVYKLHSGLSSRRASRDSAARYHRMPEFTQSRAALSALDALRGGRDREYFRVLFSLPDAAQHAEMSTWTERDHAAAVEYLGVRCDGCGADDDDGGPDDIGAPAAPPPAFDEEDHFG